MENDISKKVLSSLQRQCSRRECCSSDIYKKALKALDGDAAKAAAILESLKADKYVEITPHHLRMRKIILDELERKRLAKASGAEE